MAVSLFLMQRNVDKDQVKAAIRAQQDQQIDNVSIVIVMQDDVYGNVFFFDKSIYYIKKRKGAQPVVHWEYTKGFRERKKIRKGNLQS
jgi:phage terminase small subunit